MNVAYNITPQGLALFIEGRTHLIPKDHRNFERVKQALRDKQYEDIEGLLDPQIAVAKWVSTDPRFEQRDGLLFYEGEPFDSRVSEKIFTMIDLGLPSDPLLRFLEKVRENPSNRAQTDLFPFAQKLGFLIDEEGNLMCYKGVAEDYLSIQADKNTGQRVDNHVGETPSMPRHLVDDNPNNTCSHGLHVSTKRFADGYGVRTLLVRVHPKDVVAIPTCSEDKMRVCRYEVVAELNDRVHDPVPEVVSQEEIDRLNTERRKWEILDVVGRFTQKDVTVEDTMDDLDLSRTQRESLAKQLVDEFLGDNCPVDLDAIESTTTVRAIIDDVEFCIRRQADARAEDEAAREEDLDDEDDEKEDESKPSRDQVRDALIGQFQNLNGQAQTVPADDESFDDLDCSKAEREMFVDKVNAWFQDALGDRYINQDYPDASTTFGEFIDQVHEAID